MSSRRWGVAAAAALASAAALVAAPARAEDQPQVGRVEATLSDAGQGTVLNVRGTSMPVPDGTRLEVQFVAKGESRDFVCALFRVRVEGNAYAGSKQWARKRPAPLVYEAQVHLSLAKQQAAVRTWLMQEYGFTANHKEVVDTCEVTVGTPQERAEFAKANLEQLRVFATELETHRRRVADAMVSPPAEGADRDALVRDLNTSLLAYRRALDGYEGGYLILLERGFLGQLLDGVKLLGRAVRALDQGRSVSGLDALQATIDTLQRHITDRLPVDRDELVHPDASPVEGEDGE